MELKTFVRGERGEKPHSNEPKRRRKKRHMSPEARKAAAERMKAYWAEKRQKG